MNTYYEDQLKKLIDCSYSKGIKIFDGCGHSTNQLNLNDESIPILIEWLENELYKITGSNDYKSDMKGK